jgi:squalene-hopene/tetraprenyl-beta-curcumene cyclase
MSTVTSETATQNLPQIRTGQFEGKRSGQAASSVDEAIDRTHALLRDIQSPDGWWWGELESNPTMEAEYVFLTHILGIADPDRNRKIATHIEQKQGEDGGWSLYFGGPGDVSTSVECYTAMKIAGRDIDSPQMTRAREFILSHGGVPKCRVFTKIWLAMIGQWEWAGTPYLPRAGTPYLPPEIIFFPTWAPFNIYSFASWTRATVVPMTIILSENPTYPLPPDQAIDELFPLGRENTDYSLPTPTALTPDWFVFVTDRILHRAEKIPFNPARGLAKRRVEKWIVDHQENDGSWGGIQPPWVYSLIALKVLGYGIDHPVMQRGLAGFEGFAIGDSDDEWRVQACISPVWDTGLTVNALLESGMSSDDPTVVKAADWLVSKQIREGGDWQFKVPSVEPAGWAFEFDNNAYPDTDDVAEVLLAIGRTDVSEANERDAAVKRALTWLAAMQSGNGGWGSFDKDNTSRITVKLPFFDFGEVIDPPSVDVTAHILEAFGRLDWPNDSPEIKRAISYIMDEQEQDGAWFGRWGVNYLYGTGAVLPGLEAIGFDMSDPRIQKAADWVEAHQNPDGGWGESCASYADPSLRGKGESTASQTAWAMLALISAGRVDREAVAKGANYLVISQGTDGAWVESQYTATGFPGYGTGNRRFMTMETSKKDLLPVELPAGFMIKYHMYRIYWPLLALGRYRTRIGKVSVKGSRTLIAGGN